MLCLRVLFLWPDDTNFSGNDEIKLFESRVQAVDFMARALELADRVRGRTSPNPAVGAVVVADGVVVGEGATQPAGGRHAECLALEAAGARARGATLYVTLEPCCHFGRTPPCTEAIIAAGIAEVHAATHDPNPLVNGKGFAALEAARVRVIVGERVDEARRTNDSFAKHVTTRRPFVTAKWAMTLDGKIATSAGHARWISSEPARHLVHDLRDRADAILVGVQTVIADDPALTVRLPADVPRRSPRPSGPLRVVVDSTGRIPLESRLLAPELARGTIVAVTEAASPERREALARSGAEIVVLSAERGRVNLSELLGWLGERNVLSLLVEGGGEVIASLVEAGLVDEIYAFIAPKIVGGEGPTPVRGCGVMTMDQARRMRLLEVNQVGEDVLLVGRLVTQEGIRDYWCLRE